MFQEVGARREIKVLAVFQYYKCVVSDKSAIHNAVG